MTRLGDAGDHRPDEGRKDTKEEDEFLDDPLVLKPADSDARLRGIIQRWWRRATTATTAPSMESQVRPSSSSSSSSSSSPYSSSSSNFLPPPTTDVTRVRDSACGEGASLLSITRRNDDEANSKGETTKAQGCNEAPFPTQRSRGCPPHVSRLDPTHPRSSFTLHHPPPSSSSSLFFSSNSHYRGWEQRMKRNEGGGVDATLSSSSLAAAADHLRYSVAPCVEVPEPSEHISPFVALAAGKYFGVEKFVVDEFQARYRCPGRGRGRYYGSGSIGVSSGHRRRDPVGGPIKSACVGLMSPDPENPTKRFKLSEVLLGKDDQGNDNGSLGYAQVLLVELSEPPSEHFVDLIRFFFEFHDPTSTDRQGHDRGYQYGSHVLCADEEQAHIVRAIKDELQGLIDAGVVKCFRGGPKVVTEVGRMSEFFSAPEEHRDFVNKHRYIGWSGL